MNKQMNERVKELIEQCTKNYSTYFDGRGNVEMTLFDKEQFAKLLVQECGEFCGQVDRDAMFEHFGVE